MQILFIHCKSKFVHFKRNFKSSSLKGRSNCFSGFTSIQTYAYNFGLVPIKSIAFNFC